MREKRLRERPIKRDSTIRPSRLAKPTLLMTIILVLSLPARAQSGPATGESPERIVRERLIGEIGKIARDFDGVMGVAIGDLKTGDEILLNADMTFPTGSSIKVPILIELQKQAAAGRYSLSDTRGIDEANRVGGSGVISSFLGRSSQLSLHDLAVLMIALSDNTATNMLIDQTGMANINRTLDEAGLKNIRLQRKMLDTAASARGVENLATPREAMRLMRMLARGEMVTPEVSRETLKILRLRKSSPIPQAIPPGIPVANKPGGLEGVSCDWAAVELTDRPFVIAIMTTFNGVNASADSAIIRVAALAWDYFSRLSRSSRYGVRNPVPKP